MKPTHVLKVAREGELLFELKMIGSDTDADRMLGQLWNITPAPTQPDRGWRASATRRSDGVRVSFIS